MSLAKLLRADGGNSGYLHKWWLANEIIVQACCKPLSKYLPEETRRFALEVYDVIRFWKDERQ